MHDGRFYVVDEGEGDGPLRLMVGQPDEGFESQGAATAWVAENASGMGSFSIRQYSSFFAEQAHDDGMSTAERPREDEPWPRGEIAAMGSFDVWNFDARVLALAGITIERVPVPEGGEYMGDYARLVLRFPTGDGLVISPRVDGTMVMAWNYPPPPRDKIVRFGEGHTPEAIRGMPMYAGARGEGSVLGHVVQVAGVPGDVVARLRLTDAGRAAESRR